MVTVNQDAALINRLIGERPWIGPPGMDVDQFLAVFQVKDGEACFWTMADNLKEDPVPG